MRASPGAPAHSNAGIVSVAPPVQTVLSAAETRLPHGLSIYLLMSRERKIFPATANRSKNFSLSCEAAPRFSALRRSHRNLTPIKQRSFRPLAFGAGRTAGSDNSLLGSLQLPDPVLQNIVPLILLGYFRRRQRYKVRGAEGGALGRCARGNEIL